MGFSDLTQSWNLVVLLIVVGRFTPRDDSRFGRYTPHLGRYTPRDDSERPVDILRAFPLTFEMVALPHRAIRSGVADRLEGNSVTGADLSETPVRRVARLRRTGGLQDEQVFRASSKNRTLNRDRRWRCNTPSRSGHPALPVQAV